MARMNNLLDTAIQARVLSFATDLVALIKRATLESIVDALGDAEVRPGRRRELDPPRELVPEPPPYELTPARPPVSPATGARSRAPARAPKVAGVGAVSLARYERMAIARAVSECGGDLYAAAALLGLGKSSIYRHMKTLGIEAPTRGGVIAVAPDDPLLASGEPVSLDAYEKAALVRALEQCRGDKIATAKLLGVGKSTLYRMLTKHAVR
jgi:transcriptional regulator of acetoin/glycerol metabolism